MYVTPHIARHIHSTVSLPTWSLARSSDQSEGLPALPLAALAACWILSIRPSRSKSHCCFLGPLPSQSNSHSVSKVSHKAGRTVDVQEAGERVYAALLTCPCPGPAGGGGGHWSASCRRPVGWHHPTDKTGEHESRALTREPRMHMEEASMDPFQGLLSTDRFAVTAAVSGGDFAVVAAALGLAGDGCPCAVAACAGCFAPCVAGAASLPAGALT